jgi:hypothetical protein
MKRISSKATVYLVDGSNFSMSFCDRRQTGKSDALETEFLDWLDEVSRLEVLSASCFRVIFDGGFRPVRSGANPAINIYFSEHEPADDFLLERSYFMTMEGVRCVIVSNDRGIREKAAQEKVPSIPCDVFYRLCESELRGKNR